MKIFCRNILIALSLALVSIILPLIVLPIHDDYFLAQDSKNQLLEKTYEYNRIILVGGSNVAFGFNSEMLSDSLSCPVVNMGLHAGLGMKFILDNTSQYLHAGDILVVSPEYEQFFVGLPWGDYALTNLFYIHPTKYYSLLNWQQWNTIVENTPMLAQQRALLQKQNIRNYLKSILYTNYQPSQYRSVYHYTSFNGYGDVTKHWEWEKTYNPKEATKQIKLSTPEEAFVEYLFAKLDYLESQGIQVIMYPSIGSESWYTTSWMNVAYVDSLLEENNYPYVCEPMELIYPDSLFYDTPQHLHKEGTDKRTLHLLDILQNIRR